VRADTAMSNLSPATRERVGRANILSLVEPESVARK